jgi:hypothetical protein
MKIVSELKQNKTFFIAVDATSMNITDKKDAKGLGQIGSRGSTRGLLIQSALKLSAVSLIVEPKTEPCGEKKQLAFPMSRIS